MRRGSECRILKISDAGGREGRLSAEAVARRVVRKEGEPGTLRVARFATFVPPPPGGPPVLEPHFPPASLLTTSSLFTLQPYSPFSQGAAEECPSSAGRSILNNRPALQLHHHPRALPSPRSNNNPLPASSRPRGSYQRRLATIGSLICLLSSPIHARLARPSSSRTPGSCVPIQRPKWSRQSLPCCQWRSTWHRPASSTSRQRPVPATRGHQQH